MSSHRLSPILALSAIVVCRLFAFSADIKIDDIIAGMEKADNAVNTASFNYIQETRYSLTGEKQTNSGSIVFQKPGRCYIRQVSPLEQVIVSDGKDVTVYTPSYRQAVKDTWNNLAKSMAVPVSLLNFGDKWDDSKRDYAFLYNGTEGNFYVVIMTPKKKDTWKIKLWVNISTFIPERTQLEAENVTLDVVSDNYMINPEINQNIFALKLPKDVDMISFK